MSLSAAAERGLHLRDVRAGYGRVEVLHGVDIDVPAGAIVAIVGRNGAGKSTLLRCIAGLIPTRRGTIRWDGRIIGGWSAHDRAARGMALVPDGRNVFPSLTVRENLSLFASGGDLGPALDTFPAIERLLERRAGTLSGGERQMVALSAPLVRDARLVLFDEASRGLSPAAVAAFYDTIAARRGRDRSYVIVEQYLDDALRLADVVYVLGRGEVLFAGEPAELSAAG
jgi:branched-chain amino acid transport system ATP-binding protein